MQELLKDLDTGSDALFLEGNKITTVQYDELATPTRDSLTAIDGGSAILLHTTNACVLFVRIISATMQKRIRKTEGYVLAAFKNESIHTTFYPLEGEKQPLFVMPHDQEPLSTAANLGRKILEWRAIDEVDGLVVWDGSLTPTNDIEKKNLPQKKELLALAKTTGTLGNWAIFSNSPRSPWKAHAFDNKWFVKLHAKARHYFRVDTRDDALIEQLVPWSEDPAFLGYPYPLVFADQLARVSNEEAAVLTVRLQVTAGKDWERVSQGRSATDAHEILDSLQY